MIELEEKQANCSYCHGAADLNDTTDRKKDIHD